MDIRGKTPLDLAKSKGQMEIHRFIQAKLNETQGGGYLSKTKEKGPYKCNLCGQFFVKISDLEFQINIKHILTQ